VGTEDGDQRTPRLEAAAEGEAVGGLEVVQLSGERCPWRPDDLPAVQAAGRDPLIPLITAVPAYGDAAQCAGFLRRQWPRAVDGVGWSFVIEHDGAAVGHIGLWPQPRDRERASIGYWLLAEARGDGLAVRALDILVSWAWAAVDLDRLELYVEPWNIASTRTAERVGFTAEGPLRRWERVGHHRRDMIMYALLR